MAALEIAEVAGMKKAVLGESRGCLLGTLVISEHDRGTSDLNFIVNNSDLIDGKNLSVGILVFKICKVRGGNSRAAFAHSVALANGYSVLFKAVNERGGKERRTGNHTPKVPADNPFGRFTRGEGGVLLFGDFYPCQD